MNKLKLAELAQRWRAKMATLGKRDLRRDTSGRMSAEGIGLALAVSGGVLALIALVGLLFVPVATFPVIDAEVMALFGIILIVAGSIVHES